jgi:hypothetical protein
MTAATEPGTRSRHRGLGRYFMARTATLPYEAVSGLACADTTSASMEILELESRLAVDADLLSDVLHGLIGANEDAESRRLLLALRRAIHNGKQLADRDRALAVVTGLDPAAGAQVQAWFQRRDRLAELIGSLGSVLATEVAESRANLWRLVDRQPLRAGLQVASPALDRQLDALFSGGRPPQAKKLRRIERSVVSYLYRTACKTSPFSSFTSVAVGEFGDSWNLVPATQEPLQGYVRLNVAALARIMAAVAADPGRRGDLPVTVSPGLRKDPDRLRYVRRWVTQGDDDAAVSFDSIRDGMFHLRRVGLLDRLIERLGDGNHWRWSDLTAWLGEEAEAPPDQVEEYLDVLSRLGIIQTGGFAVDVHTSDPVQRLRDVLAAFDLPWADRLAGGLGGLQELIDTFRGGDVPQRREALHRLREAVIDIQAGLGAESPSVPQTLVYEDCRTESRLELPADEWERLANQDLAAVEAILPTFDMTLPHRVTFQGFFTARYGRGGRCDDLLRLVEDFHEDIYDQYQKLAANQKPFDADGTFQPEENWLGRPEMVALDRARQELAAYLESVAADPAAAEVSLDTDRLHAIGGGLSGLFGGFTPQCHMVQVARGGGESVFVLNQSLGGVSFPFSRFTHAFTEHSDELSVDLRSQGAAIAPRGAVLAEVTGGSASTNLNLHTQLTDYVIVCPGEVSDVPAENQLPLADLSLRHDVDEARVLMWSTRLDREVVPVYLGYLVPMALPQLHRTLLMLAPNSLAAVDAWRGVPEPPSADGVVARPRLVVGSVVLSRRSWSMVASALPRRTDGLADAEWFLGWQRWRRRHGLPAQVFATVYEGSGRPKPQYVDCTSYVSLLVLEASISAEDSRVVLREMLPSPADLGTGRVTELVVETYPLPLEETND